LKTESERHELYHEIFGSVLDRSELTPYLLRDCADYRTAIGRATLMMANRGFAIADREPAHGELERAAKYVERAIDYLRGYLIPSVSGQLGDLCGLQSRQAGLYRDAIESLDDIRALVDSGALACLIREDPRHLFLLASSGKYPHIFRGYTGAPEHVPPRWRLAACSILKLCHLIKAIEEDSQDIFDYASLGLFLRSRRISLSNLYRFPWHDPAVMPEDENARRAFVKVSAFFNKLCASVTVDAARNVLVFGSGDGINVDLVEIKARLKSPESMFAKLGKDAAEEVYDIRDIVAVTFILKDRDDSLTLFHALQKQGVILQENTSSASITQTLFDGPDDMRGAVRSLMRNLRRREGITAEPDEGEVSANAESFYRALGINARANPHSSDHHRKFQCKLNFSVPVRHDGDTGRILLPGDPAFPGVFTRQHTLPVELRISDVESWERSELSGEAHHDAYKCRQLLSLLDRLFSPLFRFPADALPQLRRDQERLFSAETEGVAP